jgi:hypothetical protein
VRDGGNNRVRFASTIVAMIARAFLRSPSSSSSSSRTASGASRAFGALIALVLVSSAGCKDKAKEDAAKAATQVNMLAALADKDVGEVERGMPEGAKKLAALWAKGADPSKDLLSVRSALRRVRRDVPDLNLSKATFFALTDDKGVAVRNDLEEDVMAGQDLFKIFPELAKAKSGFFTTTGAFPQAQPDPKRPPDKDWVAAVPVKREDDSVGGYFVAGWTYRYFARHLSESLKSQLTEAAQKSGDKKLPVYYVGVFDKTGVYTAPLTPSINEQELAKIDLVGKSAGGTFQATITITERAFGYAAARTPKLGPDTGIVLLWSEL